MHQITWFWPPKIEKSPYRGRGETPLPTPSHPARFASLPSGLVAPLPRIFPYKLETIPPTFEDLSTPLVYYSISIFL